MKVKSVGARISIELHEFLKTVAREKNITISEIINDALEMYLSSLSTKNLTREEMHYLTTVLTYQYLNLGKELFDNNKEEIIKQTTENIKQTRTKR